MRFTFRLRRDAAPGAAEGLLRQLPALPADWQEPPTVPSLEDLVRAREPGRAQECGRWKRAKPHDQHHWDHERFGRVVCPGYRPLT